MDKRKKDDKIKNLPVHLDLTQDAGEGFEGTTKESFLIPFLLVLQVNSPQCNESDPNYIERAKPGYFFNSATKEVHDGKLGIYVLHAAYQRRLVEWVPRERGGGYRGDHDPEKFDLMKIPRDDSGKWVLPNGNHLVDTRYHFCIQITKAGPQPVVLALSSTQIKSSREWMTAMDMYRIHDEHGNAVRPATRALLTKLTTVDKSNEKGRWKVLRAEVQRLIDPKNEAEVLHYLAAKNLHDQVISGVVRIERPSEDEDVQF